jgi:hypothetical protein
MSFYIPEDLPEEMGPPVLPNVRTRVTVQDEPAQRRVPPTTPVKVGSSATAAASLTPASAARWTLAGHSPQDADEMSYYQSSRTWEATGADVSSGVSSHLPARVPKLEEGPLGGAGPAGNPLIIALTEAERAAAAKAEQKLMNKRAKLEGKQSNGQKSEDKDKVHGKKAKEDKNEEGQQKTTRTRKNGKQGSGEKQGNIERSTCSNDHEDKDKVNDTDKDVKEEDKDKEGNCLEPMPKLSPFDVDQIFKLVSQDLPRTTSVHEDKDKEGATDQGDKNKKDQNTEGKSMASRVQEDDKDKEGHDHDDDDGKEKGKDNSASTFAGRCPPKTADKLKHFCGVRDAYHSVLLEAGVHMPGMKQRDFMNFVQQRHGKQDALDYRALACEWLVSQEEPKKRKGASETEAGAAPRKMVKQSGDLAE